MQQVNPGLVRAHKSMFCREVVCPLLIASGYSVNEWGIFVERIEINGSRCWEYSVILFGFPVNRPRVDKLVFRSMELASVGARDFIEDVVAQAIEYLYATEPEVKP